MYFKAFARTARSVGLCTRARSSSCASASATVAASTVSGREFSSRQITCTCANDTEPSARAAAVAG